MHLHGEFARWREDEGARAFAFLFAFDEAGEDGQNESGGFAAASLRGKLQVAPSDGKRNGLRLDGGGGGVAAVGDGFEQGLRKMKVVEGLHG